MRLTTTALLTALSFSLLPALPARADEAACIAASEQSLALRKQGKLHATLEQLAICSDTRCSTEVRTECAQRIAAIDAAMPTLVLAARDGAGNDLYEVRVSMDGTPLAERLDGRPITVDPGEHAFTFETAGQPPQEKKLVVREGEKDRHETIVIGAQPPPPPAVAPAALAEPPPEAARSSWTARKSLAVASAGLGVIGLGAGAWFAAFAASSQSKEKGDCSIASCPRPNQAREDYDTAKSDALGSTIAFAGGAAFVVAGAVLWFTAPAGAASGSSGAVRWRVAPVADGRSGRLVVGGEF